MAEIQRCIDAKVFPATVHPMVAFRVLTMGILGTAVMQLSQRLAPGEDADLIAADVLNVTLAGLQTPYAPQSRPFSCPGEESDEPAAAQVSSKESS